MTRLAPQAAAKLIAQARANERSPKARAIPDRRIPRNPTIRPAMFCYIPTAIPARMGTFPNFAFSSASVQMLRPNATGDGTENASASILAFNALNVEIPADRVGVLSYVDGLWVVTLADC